MKEPIKLNKKKIFVPATHINNLSPGLWLHHPNKAQKDNFGTVPEVTSRGILIPGGIIRLKHGRHTGPNKGFGATHIWAEHQSEMLKAGFSEENQVADYVASIIEPGTPIFCEFSNMKNFQRLAVVKSARGLAILEFKGTVDDGHYSVVTAYANRQTHGTLVGTVR
jgi:hypothetical protein